MRHPVADFTLGLIFHKCPLADKTNSPSVKGDIKLAPLVPLKMLLAKELSEPIIRLVAAAKSNCKTTVFSLDCTILD